MLERIVKDAEDSFQMSGGLSFPIVTMQDRKQRRAIANNNERRRMQSINAGFEKLKELICPLDKDKLSKASVLHQAVEYIYNLSDQNRRLIAKNEGYKRILHDLGQDTDTANSDEDVAGLYRPPSKRRKQDTESSDEGVSGLMPEVIVCVDDMRRELLELRCKLEVEHRIRFEIERRCKQLMESHATMNGAKPLSNVGDDICGVQESKDSSATTTSKKRITEEMYDTPMLTGVSKGAIVTSRHDNDEQTAAQLWSSRGGNLETIVEAINHLEETNDSCFTRTAVKQMEDQDCAWKQISGKNCETIYLEEAVLEDDEMLPTACKSSEAQQLIAAAEALEYIAGRHGGFRQMGTASLLQA